MDVGTSVAVSVGIVTFGSIVLGVIKMFKSNPERNPNSNPGSSTNKFVSGKECGAYRQGFERQLEAMGKALSKEIGQTRDTLVREIGEIKKAIQK